MVNKIINNFFSLKKYIDQAEQPCAIITDGSLLSKVPSLLNKAKSLCKDTMTNTGYPSLVQALDDFVTMVIETSTHLGSLEVCFLVILLLFILYLALCP